MIPYSNILFFIVCAAFYYRVGQSEQGQGFLWASVSVLVAIVSSFVLHVGTTGFLLCQTIPFIAMTAYNVSRDTKKRDASKKAED